MPEPTDSPSAVAYGRQTLQRLTDVITAFEQVVQHQLQLLQGRAELAAVVGHKSRKLL